MIEIAQDILTYLSSCGFGTPGVNLFVNPIPSTPESLVGLILTGGWETPGTKILRPSFQIVHRNTNAQSGLSMITSIYHALDSKWNLSCRSRGFVMPMTPPGGFYKDANHFLVYTLNFVFSTTKKS